MAGNLFIANIFIIVNYSYELFVDHFCMKSECAATTTLLEDAP